MYKTSSNILTSKPYAEKLLLTVVAVIIAWKQCLMNVYLWIKYFTEVATFTSYLITQSENILPLSH